MAKHNDPEMDQLSQEEVGMWKGRGKMFKYQERRSPGDWGGHRSDAG